MHGSSGVYGGLNPYHASPLNALMMQDRTGARSPIRKVLKEYQAYERKQNVVRSGVTAGDRILHRLPLKASEMDLFCPPTKLPQQKLCENDRARWRSVAWESFSNHGPSSSPAPGSIGSRTESWSSVCSSLLPQSDSVQYATPQKHHPSIIKSEHVEQLARVPDMMAMTPTLPVTFVDDRERRSTGTVLHEVVESFVKSEKLDQRQDPKQTLVPQVLVTSFRTQSDSEIDNVLATWSNHDENCRDQPMAIAWRTDRLVSRGPPSKTVLSSVSSDRNDARTSCQRRPSERQRLVLSERVAYRAQGVKKDSLKPESTKTPEIRNARRTGCLATRVKKYRSFLSDTTSDEEDDKEVSVEDSTGVKLSSSAEKKTSSSAVEGSRSHQEPEQAPMPLRVDHVKGSKTIKDVGESQNAGCEESKLKLYSIRDIERILARMKVPSLLPDIDDGAAKSGSIGKPPQAVGSRGNQNRFPKQSDTSDKSCHGSSELDQQVIRKTQLNQVRSSCDLRIDSQRPTGRKPSATNHGERRKYLDSSAVLETHGQIPIQTCGSARISLESGQTRNGKLHWGKTLSKARRRAAAEQTRASISAFLEEAEAHKRAAREEPGLIARSMNYLESAACSLLASELMPSSPPQFNPCARRLEETLRLVERAFGQGLHLAPPTSSQSCRLAILFLEMLAFLNHRLGSIWRVDNPSKLFTKEKLSELAALFLNSKSWNFRSSENTAKSVEDQHNEASRGFEVFHYYRTCLNRKQRATELWTRAKNLADISENKVFFNAVESGSVVPHVDMPTTSFVFYVREAIHRIQVFV